MNLDGEQINMIYITITCPCGLYPLTPHFYIVKLGYRGILYFLIFALKHGSWVHIRTASLTEAVLMCTHDLCFEQKLEKYHNCSSENYRFYNRENWQNIT